LILRDDVGIPEEMRDRNRAFEEFAILKKIALTSPKTSEFYQASTQWSR
jgi:hypothetical protein